MQNKTFNAPEQEVSRRLVQGDTEMSTLDPDTALESIMEGLADTVLELRDEELLAELSDQGRDPVAEAEQVRKTLVDALKAVAPQSEPEE